MLLNKRGIDLVEISINKVRLYLLEKALNMFGLIENVGRDVFSHRLEKVLQIFDLVEILIENVVRNHVFCSISSKQNLPKNC